MVKKKTNTTSVNTEESRDNIIDVNLEGIKKQRFRFNDNDNMILELNTSDAGMLKRLEPAYAKLDVCVSKLEELETSTDSIEDEDNVSEDKQKELADKITELDNTMREIVDEIFDAPVSTTLVPNGTMWDPINGKFRYEHIIEKLTELYEQNIKEESRKMKARLSKHTKKYHK